MSKEVLARIDQRLAKLRLKEATAAKRADLSDSAIRNVRRVLKNGGDAKFSMRTLEALAPVLETSVSWLAEEIGPEEAEPMTSEERQLLKDYRGLPENVQEAMRTIARGSGNTKPEDGK